MGRHLYIERATEDDGSNPLEVWVNCKSCIIRIDNESVTLKRSPRMTSPRTNPDDTKSILTICYGIEGYDARAEDIKKFAARASLKTREEEGLNPPQVAFLDLIFPKGTRVAVANYDPAEKDDPTQKG